MNNCKHRRKIRIATIILALFWAFSISACSFSDFSNLFSDKSSTEHESIEESSDGVETGETEKSSFFIDIKPGQTIEGNDNYTNDSISEDERSIDDISDESLITCISSALADFADEIDLTPCLEGYRVEENRIDELIARVVEAFEYEYMQNPFVFHLDGSMQVGYELQSGWGSRYLTGMTLKLQRHDRYMNHDVTELDQIKLDMLDEAQSIVELAGTDRADWEKLLIAHDELVRRISYDNSLDQSTNQAASALLDNISLCKGYAQSYKLICDLMSIDCEVVSGQADGIEHAWNIVALEGDYYHIDVTHDDPVPDRGPAGPVDHRHFLRSDEMMSITHQWEQENFNSSVTDGVQYFRQNDLVVSDLGELDNKLDKFLMITDFDDERDDQLELFFEGEPAVTQEAFDSMFKDALAGSSLKRQRFSYQVSADKNVLQLIIVAE